MMYYAGFHFTISSLIIRALDSTVDGIIFGMLFRID